MQDKKKDLSCSSFPPQVGRLVDRFQRIDTNSLSEEDVRVAFINPLFKALGWPVDSIGLRREVRHEDKVRTQDGALKAPDYGFYLGNRLKFYVEAKQPGINISRDTRPAFQLRRYAWSANLPVSILTDFEELAVYDSRIEPKETDNPAHARLSYFRFTEYEENWAAISSLFSREAVLNGSIDILAAEERRGSATVDEAFLEEIEAWREDLTEELAVNHPELSLETLSYSVEKIIDRIIFLRIAEDRGLEEYGQLRSAISQENAYTEVVKLFKQADARYNSGIFHFRNEAGQQTEPDQITTELQVSKGLLAKIVNSLYYPKPYAFAAIPSDILGRIYEQFLGKVIRLTADGPRVVEKPEVRKAGGVYYTPLEVVEWMIERALHPLVDGKTPRQLESLRILDPACGSGSFLIAAYDYLLRYHRDWYVADNADKWAEAKNPRLFFTASDEWRLSISERKRILTNNVYGVDIDPQATEVAKLSLLLKVLEGESEQVLQLSMFKERALPDLGANIKCGNSLISFDVGNLLPSIVDEVEPINSFDWHTEFQEIFTRNSPGFDAVVGNPPYVDSEWMTIYRPTWRRYISERYSAASGNWDLFCVFIEKSMELLRKGGVNCFIVPNKVISAEYAKETRKILSENNKLVEVRDYSAVPVFPVSVYPIVYVSQRSKPSGKSAKSFVFSRMQGKSTALAKADLSTDVEYKTVVTRGEAWPIFGDFSSDNLLEKIESCAHEAGDVVSVLGAATVSEAYDLLPLIEDKQQPPNDYVKVINSGTIDPFEPLWGIKPMRYIKTAVQFPVINLHNLRKVMRNRADQALTPKVIVAGMTKQLEAVADTDGCYLAAKSTTIMVPRSQVSVAYLAGLMNSRLMTFVMKRKFGGLALSGGYLRVGPPQVRKLPIKVVDEKSEHETQLSTELINQVSEITQLKSAILQARTPPTKSQLKRKLAAEMRELDKVVYALYGLDEKDIEAIS